MPRLKSDSTTWWHKLANPDFNHLPDGKVSRLITVDEAPESSLGLSVAGVAPPWALEASEGMLQADQQNLLRSISILSRPIHDHL